MNVNPILSCFESGQSGVWSLWGFEVDCECGGWVVDVIEETFDLQTGLIIIVVKFHTCGTITDR